MAKLKSDLHTDAQIMTQVNDWVTSSNDHLFNAVIKLSKEASESKRLFSHSPVVAFKWEQQVSEETTLLSTQTTAKPLAKSKTSFDYLINAAQIGIQNENVVEIDPFQTLEYGVWSTYSEAILVSDEPKRDGLAENSISAANSFSKALTQKGFDVLSTEKLEATSFGDERDIPVALAQRITESPDYVFLVAKPTVKTAPIAYYRINRVTGEALGYSEDGRGSSDYAVKLGIDVAMALFVAGTMKCVISNETDAAIIACAGCAIASYAAAVLSALVLTPVGGVIAGGSVGAACLLA